MSDTITCYGSLGDKRLPPEGTRMGATVFRPVPGKDGLCTKVCDGDDFNLTPSVGEDWDSFVKGAIAWARHTFQKGDQVRLVAYWSEVHQFTV